MAATRRLQKELGEIRGSQNKSFRDVQVINYIKISYNWFLKSMVNFYTIHILLILLKASLF